MSGRFRLVAALAALLAVGPMAPAEALEMSVFGDMSLADSDAPANEPSFRLGSLDLYALQYIDEKTKALFETQFQTFAGRNGVDVEIQRFLVTREVNDHFQIGLGRFHTPLGYWNTHYHHGILLQDTISRPFFLGFEGNNVNALWPIHLVGAMAEGEIADGFSYEAAVANSNNINSSATTSTRLNIPTRTDYSGNKSLFGRVWYDVYGSPFKPGLFMLRNDVVDSSPLTSTGDPLPTCGSANPAPSPCSLVERGDPLVTQTMVGTDLRYELERFNFLGEFYWLQNDAHPGVGDGRTHDAIAYYAQFGFNFNRRLRATYRYEALKFDDDPGNQDPYFMDPRLLARNAIGTDWHNVFCVRYDFSESNAIMLEVSTSHPQLADESTTTILSWAFVMY